MSWWTRWFADVPVKPQKVDVGKLHVKVELNDGNVHSLTYTGNAEIVCGYTMAFDAAWHKQNYLERCGNSGTAYIGDGTYIPTCNVKKISFEIEKFEVEVEDSDS